MHELYEGFDYLGDSLTAFEKTMNEIRKSSARLLDSM